MPTYGTTEQFRNDYRRLSREERAAFKKAVDRFVEDLRQGRNFRAGLRVHPMRGTGGIFEMTWSGNNGRATFEFGPQVKDGEVHVIWRRVGGHDIFGRP